MNKKLWPAFAVLLAVIIAVAWLYDSAEPPAGAPRVLVSVDKHLWNRIGFSRLTYARALRAAGVSPVIIDFTAMQDANVSAEALLSAMDGLLLSGGGDVDPRLYKAESRIGLGVKKERDAFEWALLSAARQKGLPVLGICRGAQLINVYLGGTLGDMRADIASYGLHRKFRSGHAVNLKADSRLAEIFGATRLDSVISFHGQHVEQPGKGVRIVGLAPDGTPEAFEVDNGWIGVQWHPEFLPRDIQQARLFNAFADAAAGHQMDGQSTWNFDVLPRADLSVAPVNSESR